MGLLGSILKGAGEIIGGVGEFAIKGTGQLVGSIAESLGEYEAAEFSRSVGDGLGKCINQTAKFTGNVVGSAVDTFVDVSSELGGGVGNFIAEARGADSENYEKVGKIIGGAAAGFIVGEFAGAAITGITASTAAASTGTAISSLHGAAQTSATLAHIGGGTLSAGGGGMAAGQAVLNGVSTAATIAGSAHQYKPNKSNKNTQYKEQEKVIITCGNCSQKMRVPKDAGRIVVTCPGCRKELHYGNDTVNPKIERRNMLNNKRTNNINTRQMVSEENREKVTIQCGVCLQKLRVPKGKGNLVVTCPKCKRKFNYNSNL